MFNAEYGGQISWLLPAAVLLLAATLVITRGARRTNRTRAAMLLWGGWLVITAATFSLGQGIIHPYYSVALAPAIGAVVGIGGALLWSRRADPVARALLAATVAVTAVWSFSLLERTPAWHPGLRTLVLVGGLAISIALLAVGQLNRRARAAVAAGALAFGLLGPSAYTLATAATPHSGAIPSAGPAGAGFAFGRGPGGAGGAFRAASPGNGAGGAVGAGGAGGLGGLLNGSRPTADVVAVLQQNSDRYTWVAAAVGSNTAAGYQLATDDPIMAIGGFNGTDPAPTLEQFQAYVAAGRIHYFIAGGGRGFGGGGFAGVGPGAGPTSATVGSQITAWVEANFGSTTVGGVTLYDLSSAAVHSSPSATTEAS